jgi:HD superfamily phosphodiesterase
MKCPGQDSRFWKPGAIFEASCPQCDANVEFFKDDTARNCPSCGHRFVNPEMDFGCASYCQFAEQCLGSLPPEIVAQQRELLKEKVAMAMRHTFGKDHRRIRHATRVAEYAERIGKEENADMAVVIISAYLHDIGIPEAERKYGSASPEKQHQEGPPVARRILEALGTEPELVDRVCDIVGRHHQPEKEESAEFKAVYDADRIVNLQERREEGKDQEPDRLGSQLEQSCLTASGIRLGKEVLSARDEQAARA